MSYGRRSRRQDLVDYHGRRECKWTVSPHLLKSRDDSEKMIVGVSVRDNFDSLRCPVRILLGVIVTWIGVVSQLFSAGESTESVMEIVKRQILDIGAVNVSGKEYVRARNYQVAVSPSGIIGILRLAEPGYRASGESEGQSEAKFIDDLVSGRGEDVYRSVSLLVEGLTDGWAETELSLAGPYQLSDAPRLAFDPANVPILTWLEREIQKDRWVSRVVSRRLLPNREWSEKIVLSDGTAESISSFSICNVSDSAFEVVWTGSRVRHSGRKLSRARHDDLEKVYSRTLREEVLGPIVRISPKRGKYDATPVKVRGERDGTLYAVWDQYNPKEVYELFLAVYQDEVWSEPISISVNEPKRKESYSDSSGKSYLTACGKSHPSDSLSG